MGVDPGVRMALTADVFHFFTLGAPVRVGRKGFKILGPHGQRGLGFPGQAFGDIVGARYASRSGHVAGRAGGRSVVDAGRPGAGRGVKIGFILKGMVQGSVLGFFIDFDLGMIRTQMTLVAGFGHAGFGDRKPVAGVAGGARSLAAVQVQTSHADIRPGFRIDIALIIDFDHCPVTAVAAGFALVIGIHALVQPGIDLPHDLDGVGMFGTAVLHGFVRVAAGAVLGRNDGCDGHLVLGFSVRQIAAAVILIMAFGDVLVAGLGHVTIQTTDVGIGMTAFGPISKYAGLGRPMAFNASHCFGRYAALDAILFYLRIIGLFRLHLLRSNSQR